MEMLGKDLKKFCNIFQDYESFKDWYTGQPLSDNINDVPDIKTFTLIFNEYGDSTSAFFEDTFKNRFANLLYTYYKEFESTTRSIVDLMNLTDDDISVDTTMITNIADIPEAIEDTNTETVNFISNQQKLINKKGLLQIKREQLSNKRIFTVNTFLKRFRVLFRKIISDSYVHLVEENEHE